MDDIKFHLRGLRTTYMKERRKSEDAKSPGSGRNEIYTPQWKFYEDLHFLARGMKPHGTESNLPLGLRQDDDEGNGSESHAPASADIAYSSLGRCIAALQVYCYIHFSHHD